MKGRQFSAKLGMRAALAVVVCVARGTLRSALAVGVCVAVVRPSERLSVALWGFGTVGACLAAWGAVWLFLDAREYYRRGVEAAMRNLEYDQDHRRSNLFPGFGSWSRRHAASLERRNQG